MFIPEIVSTLRGYTRRQLFADLQRRRHRRHRRPPAGHRVRASPAASRPSAGCHRHRRRLPDLGARRLARADRRAHRRVRRHRLRHRPEVRLRRAHGRHAHGRRASSSRWALARLGAAIKFIPLSRGDRLHERHRGHHLLQPGQGPARPAHGRRCRRDSSRSGAPTRRIGSINWYAIGRRRRRRSPSCGCWPKVSSPHPGAIRRPDRRRPSLVRLSISPVETIGTRFGAIARTLPQPVLPRLSFDRGARCSCAGVHHRAARRRSSRCSPRSSPTA